MPNNNTPNNSVEVLPTSSVQGSATDNAKCKIIAVGISAAALIAAGTYCCTKKPENKGPKATNNSFLKPKVKSPKPGSNQSTLINLGDLEVTPQPKPQNTGSVSHIDQSVDNSQNDPKSASSVVSHTEEKTPGFLAPTKSEIKLPIPTSQPVTAIHGGKSSTKIQKKNVDRHTAASLLKRKPTKSTSKIQKRLNLKGQKDQLKNFQIYQPVLGKTSVKRGSKVGTKKNIKEYKKSSSKKKPAQKMKEVNRASAVFKAYAVPIRPTRKGRKQDWNAEVKITTPTVLNPQAAKEKRERLQKERKTKDAKKKILAEKQQKAEKNRKTEAAKKKAAPGKRKEAKAKEVAKRNEEEAKERKAAKPTYMKSTASSKLKDVKAKQTMKKLKRKWDSGVIITR